MILCAQCGAGAEPDQIFCLNCGQPVRTVAPPAVQPPATTFRNAAATTAIPEVVSPQSRSHLVALVAAGLLAIAAIAVAITVALLRHPGAALSLTPVRITATASSTKAPDGAVTYWAANVLDGNLATGWCEGTPYDPGIGEWIRLDFDREVALASVRLTPGYFKTQNLWVHNNRLAAATLHFSDGSSRRFDFADRMEEQSLELGGIKTRWLTMTIDNIYAGTRDTKDTPISEMTLVWAQ